MPSQKAYAKEGIIKDPDPKKPFCHDTRLTSEETLLISPQTRMGRKSIMVIPLQKVGDEAQLVPTKEKIPLTPPADKAEQKALAFRLLKRNLRIDNPTVVAELEDVERGTLFNLPYLKNAYPLWLTDAKRSFASKKGKVTLTLDKKLGLIIEKADKKEKAE